MGSFFKESYTLSKTHSINKDTKMKNKNLHFIKIQEFGFTKCLSLKKKDSTIIKARIEDYRLKTNNINLFFQGLRKKKRLLLRLHTN